MASPTAPIISETGITAPSFAEVLDYLQAQYRAIFGPDVYLGNDSQDGQFLGIIAAAINDANAAAVACYNAFSPHTAQGNGLSSVVKINGIKRLVASFSKADIRIVGQAGAQIANGQVEDANRNKWALPASVLIPLSGEILVTATCTTAGAIEAPPGTINKIATPALGWQEASNPTAATPGNPIENDAQLRVRQAISVAVPSLTIFEGIVGSVANISGVERIAGYENDTSDPDANGLPGHSIAIVVEGGDADKIALTIANKKTPGTGTYGDIETDVTDSVGSYHRIKFQRPDYVAVSVEISLKPLPGWSLPTIDVIKSAVADYINALPIGQDVVYSKLFVPANLSNAGLGLTYDIQSVSISADGGAAGASDIDVGWLQAAACDLADINITVI